MNISRLIFPVCILIAGALSYYSQTKGSGLTVTKIGDGYTSLLAMMTERLAVTRDSQRRRGSGYLYSGRTGLYMKLSRFGIEKAV